MSAVLLAKHMCCPGQPHVLACTVPCRPSTIGSITQNSPAAALSLLHGCVCTCPCIPCPPVQLPRPSPTALLQVLNYGQSVFEGMKAQRSAKGDVVLFRCGKARQGMGERGSTPPLASDLWLPATCRLHSNMTMAATSPCMQSATAWGLLGEAGGPLQQGVAFPACGCACSSVLHRLALSTGPALKHLRPLSTPKHVLPSTHVRHALGNTL